MTQYEYIMYKQYIDRLYMQKGIEGLDDLAIVLNQRKAEIEKERENYIQAEYEKYKPWINLLRKNFFAFIDEIPLEERKGLSFRNMAYKVAYDRNKKINELIVADFLGYTFEELLEIRQVGYMAVSVFERYLNIAGFPLGMDKEVAQMLRMEIQRREIDESIKEGMKYFEDTDPEFALVLKRDTYSCKNE